MNLEEFSLEGQFIFISMTKSALFLKKMGKGKEDFINLAKEIWSTLELNKIEDLEKTLKDYMDKQVKGFLRSQ